MPVVFGHGEASCDTAALLAMRARAFALMCRPPASGHDSNFRVRVTTVHDTAAREAHFERIMRSLRSFLRGCKTAVQAVEQHVAGCSHKWPARLQLGCCAASAPAGRIYVSSQLLEGRRSSESEQFGQKSSSVEIFGFAQQTQFFCQCIVGQCGLRRPLWLSIELH